MIIKASQRGFAAKLAHHLLNTQDNEHVTVHKIEQFSSNNLTDALLEIEAIAKGTRCKQPLFHCSFNPPANENATTKDFENAVHKTAKRMGLQSQPYVMIFHEKEGRRHAHVVYSRIDGDRMRAVNLPFFKNRLTELSKEIYLEKGWRLPNGLIDKSLKNPLNFTFAEWQQAKRSKTNPKIRKQLLQQHWQDAPNQEAFENRIKQHGFTLARGDKRPYVVVDWQGEAHSLSRQLNITGKALQSQLAPPDTLPSVDEVKATQNQQHIKLLKQFLNEVETRHAPAGKTLEQQKQAIQQAHKQAREDLKSKQQTRQQQEHAERQTRFSRGLKGFWDTLIGRKNRIAQRNQFETYQAERRDQKERDALILAQLQERQDLQKHIIQHEQTIEEEKQTAIKTVFEQETRITQSQQQEFTQEYERTIERNREHKRNWDWDF